MIKANTNIVIGKKTFREGQTITGLSTLDRNWMLAAGYISESGDATGGESKGKTRPKAAAESQTDTAPDNE